MYSFINVVTNIVAGVGGEKYRRTANELVGADPVYSKGTQTIRTPLYFYFLPYSTVRYRELSVRKHAQRRDHAVCLNFGNSALHPGQAVLGAVSYFYFWAQSL
jgi:hypothetical protein